MHPGLLHSRRSVTLPAIGVVVFALHFAASNSEAAVDPNLGGRQAWKESLRSARRARAETRAAAKASGNRVAAQRVYPGSPYTIENLIARVQARPANFAKYHGLHYTRILLKDIRLRAATNLDCSTFHGLIAPSAYHRYLKYRRSLNPARFDFYHPILGPILEEDNRLRALVNCPELPPEFYTPPSGTPITPKPPGLGGGEVTVPEPSALALLVIGAAAIVLPRAARRRKKADPGRGLVTRAQ